MTILERLQGWGDPQDAFELVQVNATSPDAWTAQLRTREITGATAMNLTVQESGADEPVWISFEEAVPADVIRLTSEVQADAALLQRLVSAINDARAGSVTCTIRGVGGTLTLALAAVIYEDGFSRHTLNEAVCEIRKGYNSMQHHYAELTGAFQLMAQGREEMEARMRASSAAPAEVRCSSCQATSPPGSRFCNRCGTSLAPS